MDPAHPTTHYIVVTTCILSSPLVHFRFHSPFHTPSSSSQPPSTPSTHHTRPPKMPMRLLHEDNPPVLGECRLSCGDTQ